MIKRVMMLFFSFIIILAGLPVFTAAGFGIEVGRRSEIDITGKDAAYVRVRVTEQIDRRVRVKIVYENEDIVYSYNLNNEGHWEIFPLQSGSGVYTIHVLENVRGTSYAAIQTISITAEFDAFAPFLIPSQHVNFNDYSYAIQKAAELAAGAANDIEIVERIYTYVVNSFSYDNERAAMVISGTLQQYIPDLNDVFISRAGICYDYSAIIAAMLRSQGIPTKLIKGYVNVGSTPMYHAWNEVFIQGVGWYTINSEIFFDDGQWWGRMDSTLASNNEDGRNTEFMRNFHNYIKDREF